MMKYCITTVITFETTQYRESPEGKVKAKKPNMTGIIHSMMAFVDCCWDVAAGAMVIFWTTHMEPPTRTGSNGVGSGSVRSSHRKWASRGRASSTPGSHA